MQTLKGKKAEGPCREEFQAIMQYLVKPLILQQVHNRRSLGKEETISGKTMQTVISEWGKRLQDAHEALTQKKWSTFSGATHEEDVRAYKPTELPFFLSFDNAWSYSFWKDAKQKIFATPMPIPFLQCVHIAPRGHDLHQMPEHAIGCIKGHFTRHFANVDVLLSDLSHACFQKVVLAGAELYGKDAWRANIERWYKCCLFVGSPTNFTISIDRDLTCSRSRRGKRKRCELVERSGLGGSYCYPDFS